MSGYRLQLSTDRVKGRTLGKYEVLCRLSTGGMSEIFLAFQRGHGGFRRLVVLKQILPDIRGEEEIVRMFLDEAKITGAFSHPNIAQVFDLDIADGELFLAMEFVQGATLVDVARATRAADEAIPIGLTLAAVRDTALALHYAHTFRDAAGRSQPVIHRDVAEKNIMVTYDGTTKLLDFGIAKAVGRSQRTAAGRVKGTTGYMSPEQILGEELDPRSDIFSLGVVLHECLTGIRLFYDKDPEANLLAALRSDPKPPSYYKPEVSAQLDAICLRALARPRDDRFATALEFARALERASGQEIWHPEQSAEFMQRHFRDRLEQTRQLLSDATFQEPTRQVRIDARVSARAVAAEAASVSEVEQTDNVAPAEGDPFIDAVLRFTSRGALPPPPLGAPSQPANDEPKGADEEDSEVEDSLPAAERPEKTAPAAEAEITVKPEAAAAMARAAEQRPIEQEETVLHAKRPPRLARRRDLEENIQTPPRPLESPRAEVTNFPSPAAPRPRSGLYAVIGALVALLIVAAAAWRVGLLKLGH